MQGEAESETFKNSLWMKFRSIHIFKHEGLMMCFRNVRTVALYLNWYEGEIRDRVGNEVIDIVYQHSTLNICGLGHWAW